MSAAQVLHASGLLHEAQVVDYGCGFGQFTQLLAHLHPESEFVGMDVPPVIGAARKVTEKDALENLRFTELSSDLGSRGRVRIVLMLCALHMRCFRSYTCVAERLIPITKLRLPG